MDLNAAEKVWADVLQHGWRVSGVKHIILAPSQSRVMRNTPL